MTDDLDRTLSSEADIRPSPVFVRSVMAAVEREADAAPPIPFPWRRALPGIGVVAAMAIVVVFEASRLLSAVPVSGATTIPLLEDMHAPTAMWIVIGLFVSAATMALAAVRIER